MGQYGKYTGYVLLIWKKLLVKKKNQHTILLEKHYIQINHSYACYVEPFIYRFPSLRQLMWLLLGISYRNPIILSWSRRLREGRVCSFSRLRCRMKSIRSGCSQNLSWSQRRRLELVNFVVVLLFRIRDFSWYCSSSCRIAQSTE